MTKRKVITLLIAGILGLNLLVIGISCFSLLKSEQQYTKIAEVSARNLAQILEQNLSAVIRIADMGLQGLTMEAGTQLTGKITNQAEIESHIAVLRKSFPEVNGIRVADSEGDIIYGMSAGRRENISDREFFKKALADFSDTLIISKPLFDRIDKVWLIFMARRINKPDGSFGGVAYASFPLEGIEKLFSTVNVGQYGCFALRDASDLSLIVRYPEPDKTGNAIGDNKVSQEFMKIWKSGLPVGSYEAPASIDHRMRTWGFSKFNNNRYFMIAGLDKDEYLSRWRQEAFHAGMFLSIVLVSSILAGNVIFRSWKKSIAADESNRETEKLFKMIFDESPDVIVLQDDETCAYIDVNRRFCEVCQTTKEHLIGKTPDELGIMSESEITRLVEILAKDGEIDKEEAVGINIKGEPVYLQISSKMIETPAGKYALSIIHDITARKTAEEENKRLQDQLLQAQKMESIGRLVGGIAHDFNNLLTPIIGYTEMLRMKMAEDTPDRSKADHVVNAAQKAQSLVAQLLGFSRKQILTIEQVDLNTLVSTFLGILRRTIRENIEIQTHISPIPCITFADRGQLDQILMNLVVNAQDAIDGDGAIMIETAIVHVDASHARQHLDIFPGEYVVLSVGDTGHGMDKETQKKIFDPFFTTKEVGKGTGLGLATVYGLVKQQKGGIWVYSEQGKGTTFKIYFPAIKSENTGLQQSAQEDVVTYDGSGKTALLVEDEHEVRELVREFLENMNFEVVAIEDPRVALEIPRERSFDILLTDVIMPGLTGPDLYQQLLRRQPHLKALFMSGYMGNIVEASGLAGHNSNYIQKPFSGNGLAAKINKVLQ